MKLIIAGATGYVATELIRQSLRRPDVTSVVALARKATPVPSDIAPGSTDAAKLTSVVIKNYEGPYDGDDADDRVKTAIAGADACIWTVAITPSKSSAYPFDEVRRICQTITLAGLRAMHAARGTATSKTTPFRFMYMSGIAAERDQTKSPRFKPEYSLMRVSCVLAALRPFLSVLTVLALLLSSLRSLFFFSRFARSLFVLASLALFFSRFLALFLSSLVCSLVRSLTNRAKPKTRCSPTRPPTSPTWRPSSSSLASSPAAASSRTGSWRRSSA